ncbi:uncharacterized protein LOC111815648 [Octodon degus]|uniref:Uncharacterized protein LOC111815648 n=1 Tax=Octodon degus TaxID=10160 RepID=A0A6P6E3J5_OCTDE|nr:uncharacterized protein LOC111815648 [Octodon degus]
MAKVTALGAEGRPRRLPAPPLGSGPGRPLPTLAAAAQPRAPCADARRPLTRAAGEPRGESALQRVRAGEQPPAGARDSCDLRPLQPRQGLGGRAARDSCTHREALRPPPPLTCCRLLWAALRVATLARDRGGAAAAFAAARARRPAPGAQAAAAAAAIRPPPPELRSPHRGMQNDPGWVLPERTAANRQPGCSRPRSNRRRTVLGESAVLSYRQHQIQAGGTGTSQVVMW